MIGFLRISSNKSFYWKYEIASKERYYQISKPQMSTFKDSFDIFSTCDQRRTIMHVYKKKNRFFLINHENT